jgi:hypothetical protein
VTQRDVTGTSVALATLTGDGRNDSTCSMRPRPPAFGTGILNGAQLRVRPLLVVPSHWHVLALEVDP